MLTEVTHLQEIVELLAVQTADPTSLPQSSEQVILDLKGGSHDGSQKWTHVCISALFMTFSIEKSEDYNCQHFVVIL